MRKADNSTSMDAFLNQLMAAPGFHLPNLVLAGLFWLLILRVLLGGLVPEGSQNPLWRALGAIARPLANGAGWLAPHAVPKRLHILLAAGWVFAARVLFVLLMGSSVTPDGLPRPAPLPFEVNMPLPSPIPVSSRRETGP